MKGKIAKNTDLAIIHWNDVTGIIEMFDIENRRVIKRKVQYVGAPIVTAVIYQGYYHLTCNMGSIKYGEIRY